MADVSVVISHLRNQRLIIDYTFISAAALFIYDYALTLLLEIKFIWLSQWTYTKILFLLIRYMAFTDVFLFIFCQISPDISAETCNVMFPAATWLVILQIFFSEVILSIRTWAIWNRNKVVGIGLAAITITHLVFQCILTSSFAHSLHFDPPPYPGYRGCFLTKVPDSLWPNYAVAVAVNTVVLAPVIISAFRSYRRGNVSVLSRVIHRDGVLSYMYLLCITAGNLIATTILPVDMMTLLIPLLDIHYAVLTTRVVLNIREASNRGGQTELHYIDSDSFATPALQPILDQPWLGYRSSRNFEVNIELTPVALHNSLTVGRGLPAKRSPGIS